MEAILPLNFFYQGGGGGGVCLCMCTCVFTHACMWKSEIDCGYLSHHPSPYCLRQGHSVNLQLALSALPTGQLGLVVPLSLSLLPSTWSYKNVPSSAEN